MLVRQALRGTSSYCVGETGPQRDELVLCWLDRPSEGRAYGWRQCPSEDEVAESSAQDDRQGQPDVEGHDDQHEAVADS